jgi:hypothetical protein
LATNKPYGDGHRQGQVKDRSQVYNDKIGCWTKRDTETRAVYGSENRWGVL